MKSSIIILEHVDPEKSRVVDEAPTVIRSSIRLSLTLIASLGFNLLSRDISVAFLQSKDELKIDVYVKPPKDQNVLRKSLHQRDQF